MSHEVGGYIIRYARADQYPPGTNLQDAARDSVLRYAKHYGLDFRWLHDQCGTVWEWVPGEDGRYGFGVIPARAGGCYMQKSPMTVVWRSEAKIVGLMDVPSGGSVDRGLEPA